MIIQMSPYACAALVPLAARYFAVFRGVMGCP